MRVEHDERERRIQSAGKADDRRFCVRMSQTGGEAGRLKRQNLLAAFIAECLVRRNERRARERAVAARSLSTASETENTPPSIDSNVFMR